MCFFGNAWTQFKLLSTVACNKFQTKYQPTSQPINTPLMKPGSCCSRSSWNPIVFEVVIRLPLILKWYTNPPKLNGWNRSPKLKQIWFLPFQTDIVQVPVVSFRGCIKWTLALSRWVAATTMLPFMVPFPKIGPIRTVIFYESLF